MAQGVRGGNSTTTGAPTLRPSSTEAMACLSLRESSTPAVARSPRLPGLPARGRVTPCPAAAYSSGTAQRSGLEGRPSLEVNSKERQALTAAMVRLKRGDRAAADEVFRRAWPAVRAFARRWLAGSAQAEDVAQQALVKVFAQALDFDVSRDALTWVLEVTVWECRTERARLRRNRLDLGGDAVEGEEPGRPDVALEEAELKGALMELIGALPEAEQRELTRLLLEEASGDAAGRKRRQRAVEHLRALWRSLHGD